MKIKNNSYKEVYIPLLAFTFFYSVTIFNILVKFYKWQLSRETDTKE